MRSNRVDENWESVATGHETQTRAAFLGGPIPQTMPVPALMTGSSELP
jgi:hypothetical protein